MALVASFGAISASPARAYHADYCGYLIAGNDQYNCVSPHASITYNSARYTGGGNIANLYANILNDNGRDYLVHAWTVTFTSICHTGSPAAAYGRIAFDDGGASHTLYGYVDDSTSHTGCIAAAPARATTMRFSAAPRYIQARYGVFRGSRASSVRLPFARPTAESHVSARDAQASVVLASAPGELCVIVEPEAGGEVGGEACKIVNAGDTDPPVLAITDGDETLVAGGAVDGVSRVSVASSSGDRRSARPTSNGFLLRVAGEGVSSITFAKADGSSTTLR